MAAIERAVWTRARPKPALKSARSTPARLRSVGAMVRLKQTRLVARQEGVILSRTVEPGDVVQPGKTLLIRALALIAQHEAWQQLRAPDVAECDPMFDPRTRSPEPATLQS